jgi:MFS family permease
MVVACYVAYAAVGWFLSGLGSVLPDLEEDLGGRRASLYPLMPGAVLLVFALLFVWRHRHPEPANPHTSVVVAGSIGLGVALVSMGVTRWPWVSLAGGLTAAVAAAALIRLLPAALATERPDDTERVMIRANAWSSLAGITSPLAIGGAIALGFGWLPGMAVPIGIAALVVVATARPRHGAVHAPFPPHAGDAVPPLATWWREWAVLTTCIVVEFCFSYFAATYLHDELGMSTAASAAGAAAWGAGMTAGRFVVSVRPAPRTVLPSVVVVGIGFLLLWLPREPALAIAGIGVAGIGASPLYPTRATALLDRFPASPDQGAARGAVASGSALLLSPALMVGVRAATDVRIAYLVVPVLLVVLASLARPIGAARREPALVS